MMTLKALRVMILTTLIANSLGMLLHQSRTSLHRQSSAVKVTEDSRSSRSCTTLENQQTFFTVTVSVGTPPQNFSLVADTGSDSLLIPSCLCVEYGYCYTGPEGTCFSGTNASSTFKISKRKDGPPTAILTYGSGAIKVVLSSDQVQVGGVKTFMKDGVLLITDQALDFSSAFQGILGLGPPSKTPVGQMIPGDSDGNITYEESQRAKDPNAVTQEHQALKELARQGGKNSSVAVRALDAAMNDQRVLGSNLSKSFLREAKVQRFSVCFDPEKNGVLRLNTAEPKNPMRSVGGMHWGLDLQGVTTGKSTKTLNLCQAANKTNASQLTACAAIPDSGTTVMAGPVDHLIMIVEGLCDEWHRCSQLYKKVQDTAEEVQDIIDKNLGGYDPWKIAPLGKAELFLTLIDNCQTWLNGSDLSEMPDLLFHVGDLNGTKRTLKLPPSAYILEMEQSDEDDIYMHTNGLFRDRLRHLRQHKRRDHNKTSETICSPALEPMDYETPENGHIFILGLPLFYEYQVHYDQNVTNPTIGFSKVPCGSCGSAGATMVKEEMEFEGERTTRLLPRRISKPLRSKVLHKNMPF